MIITTFLCTIYALFYNLNAYKTWFQSSKDARIQFIEVKKELENLADIPKIFMISLVVIMTMPLLFFLVVASNLFMDIKILLFYSIFQIIITIMVSLKSIYMIVKEKVPEKKLWSRVLLPLNTVFIFCFFYYYLMQ